MSHDLSFSFELPADERGTLLAILRDCADDVQETESKAIDWQTIVVIMEGVGKVASGATAIVVLADKLIA
jgi:hypothetical protein